MHAVPAGRGDVTVLHPDPFLSARDVQRQLGSQRAGQEAPAEDGRHGHGPQPRGPGRAGRGAPPQDAADLPLRSLLQRQGGARLPGPSRRTDPRGCGGQGRRRRRRQRPGLFLRQGLAVQLGSRDPPAAFRPRRVRLRHRGGRGVGRDVAVGRGGQHARGPSAAALHAAGAKRARGDGGKLGDGN